MLHDILKYMYQHKVRTSNSVKCYKAFIASIPLVSYAGHSEQVAKQLLQQHELLRISVMPQSTSHQQHKNQPNK